MALKTFRLYTWFVVCETMLIGCLSTSDSQEAAKDSSTPKPETASLSQPSEDEDSPSGLPFPQKATRHYTKLLLLAYPQPGLTKINACMEQINTMAVRAGSQEDMIIAKNQLADLIDHDRQVYHYCFFHMMARLDQRLDEGGPVMETLAPIFLETMRGLWILASGLDGPEGKDRYFRYLKSRYMQISQDTFGRSMETIGPPMGNLRFDPEKRAPQTIAPPQPEAPAKPTAKSPPSPAKKVAKKSGKPKNSKKTKK